MRFKFRILPVFCFSMILLPMYIIKMVSYSQVLLEIKLVQAGKRVKINSNEEILYFSEKGKFHMWA